MHEPERRRIPEATVARLPLYFRALLETAERKISTISSERLAELAGVNAAKVRKDLSYLGSYGTRGVGYDVEYLLAQISQELGLTERRHVIIAGVGRLGQALANYAGFTARGFEVVGLFDADPAKMGHRVGSLAIEPMDRVAAAVAERNVAIAILAVPAESAQVVADVLVAAGVKAILNFAPKVIRVPEEITLRKVDLAIELQILSFYEQRSGQRLAAATIESLPRADDTTPTPVDTTPTPVDIDEAVL